MSSRGPGEGVLRQADGTPYNAGTADFNEAMNSELARETRAALLNGEKPESCLTCWQKESLGGKSKRLVSNLEFAEELNEDQARQQTARDGSIDFKVRYLDLRLGNTCNLKCIMCHPTSSNQWYDDHVAAYGDEFFEESGARIALEKKDGRKYMPVNSTFDWHEESASFWSQVEASLPHLQQVYFVGGEPLIIKRHFELLEKCIQTGHAGHIALEYDTNLVSLAPSTLALWKAFKSVNVRVSLEGVGAVNDYIRYPSRWQKIHRNIEALRQIGSPIHVDFTMTWQIYNIMSITDIWDLFDGQGHARILHAPSHLSAKILPKEIKQKAIGHLMASKHKERASHLINFLEMHLEHSDRPRLRHFVDFTSRVDSVRTLSFENLEPELWSEIKRECEENL